jgi:fluoride exporter
VLRSLAAVALGATLGAWVRWGLSAWLNAATPSLPAGTLAANLMGGYLVGVAVGFFGTQAHIAPEWRLLIVTGFLGALTTFSTFSAESVVLLQRGEFVAAFTHSAAHLFGSLAMTALGLWSVRAAFE